MAAIYQASVPAAVEALLDSRRYLTEFGSVDPTTLTVGRMTFITTAASGMHEPALHGDLARSVEAGSSRRIRWANAANAAPRSRPPGQAQFHGLDATRFDRISLLLCAAFIGFALAVQL